MYITNGNKGFVDKPSGCAYYGAMRDSMILYTRVYTVYYVYYVIMYKADYLISAVCKCMIYRNKGFRLVIICDFI